MIQGLASLAGGVVGVGQVGLAAEAGYEVPATCHLILGIRFTSSWDIWR